MEPANLNSSDDARIEALLRRSATTIPNDGFSARVLCALPPAKTASRISRKLAIIAGAAIGLVFAARGVLPRSGESVDLTGIAAELSRGVQPLLDPAFILAAAVTALSLAYVFRKQLRLA